MIRNQFSKMVNFFGNLNNSFFSNNPTQNNTIPALSAAFLVVLAGLATCDNVEKYCSNVKCTKPDMECTKPLAARSYCSCQSKSGVLSKKYVNCDANMIFNGKKKKCEPDSKDSRAFCEKHNKN
uniref:Putative conserved plasma membrane protein n=1 Tax=Culex tarsalis TaxID=7177 RepID=A0A1Q3FTP0_CULTA